MSKSVAPARSGPTRRYAATVEKGENAWRREWSGFMSNVNLKELRKGGGVVLPKAADLEVAAEGEVGHNFSYLFASPAEKKAARLEKQREEEEKQRKRMLEKSKVTDPLAHLSKHERAVYEAQKRGLNTDGMSRKELRQFLHLTISKEQQEAEKHQEEFRPHELMDEKLQWYQQGPHPIDIIAEKLVVRKATKKGKQLGLRYNYYMPHPSWLAKREQRRRERLLVGLGRRYIFDDTGKMLDAFAPESHIVSMSGIHIPEDNEKKEKNNEKEVKEQEDVGMMEMETHIQNTSIERKDNAGVCTRTTTTTTTIVPTSTPLIGSDILVDPRKACTSFVRAVVKDRNVADAIRNANITTSYISSSLVMGPSIGAEDLPNGPNTAASTANTGMERKRVRETPARKAKVVEKRSKMASFEP
ncbi:uncharacterized protein TM35_000301450 [Trypanosoma theileri]|uniref:Uncharacterized protein n=1 Tax=Trypanosoma theileri TaxID=67003 RepID=A0A1X0NN14_9TRYP|nr:uncharacterized protein TM35_000301450 [Trypanosoma theileri]ORC86105.1 hypothetical protein TM35_000301450 [Trypanosoma theileri]